MVKLKGSNCSASAVGESGKSSKTSFGNNFPQRHDLVERTTEVNLSCIEVEDIR